MIDLKNRTKVHVGCGKRDFGKDWIHVDGSDFPHVEDNTIWPLQIPDNSMDLVYASHVLEYFDREQAKWVLEDWVGVLKPGGILRLAVPNFEAMAKLYVRTPFVFDLETFLGPLYGKMQCGENTIYHKTVYDFVSLKKLMESVGLVNVKRYDWRETCHRHFDDHSQAYIPKMDKKYGTLISLNMEGTKA